MESINAAALREALDCALVVLDGFGYGRPDCVRAAYDCKTALAAPPRNCDAFSKAEVLKVLEDRSFSKEDTIEWLYSIAAERKEENNGSLNG